MTGLVAAVLVGAGFSETVGRVLPLLVRRHGASPGALARLLVAGTVVEAAVFALWPLAAGALARVGGGAGVAVGTVSWTVAGALPLLLCAVLAFPLLGPALHLAVIVGVGAGLADRLVAAGAGWWPAVGGVVAAAAGLALLLGGLRRVVATVGARRVVPR
ncbi:hypothetical protein ACQPX6_19640 [Actinomycetospora sp. CA-101289]|uniref:hypothetical protein n=1 Tax=Actinomycetospora sp. CA-101289 TaxID=3239893 RepID=UPI003D993927